VLAITSGKLGVLRLLRSIVNWRVGVRWYLVALVGLPVLNLLAFYRDIIVTVTLQGYDGTKENKAKVTAIIVMQASKGALLRYGKCTTAFACRRWREVLSGTSSLVFDAWSQYGFRPAALRTILLILSKVRLLLCKSDICWCPI